MKGFTNCSFKLALMLFLLILPTLTHPQTPSSTPSCMNTLAHAKNTAATAFAAPSAFFWLWLHPALHLISTHPYFSQRHLSIRPC